QTHRHRHRHIHIHIHTHTDRYRHTHKHTHTFKHACYEGKGCVPLSTHHPRLPIKNLLEIFKSEPWRKICFKEISRRASAAIIMNLWHSHVTYINPSVLCPLTRKVPFYHSCQN